MEPIEYNCENVYTQSNQRVTRRDLSKAQQGVGQVLDAYFFKIRHDRTVERVDFDRQAVEDQVTGLNVYIKSRKGEATVSISGLDQIAQFLCDTNSLGDLEKVKGMDVTEYGSDIQLLGIGVPQ